MEITRYHNKKEMALSKKNIVLSSLLFAFMVIVFYFRDIFNFDGVHNYYIYLIGSSFLAIVFIFTSPYIFYLNTFKGKLNITDDTFSFEDEFNMFDMKISRNDIQNIEIKGTDVMLKLKNHKTYTFKVNNADNLKDIIV